MGFAFGTGLSRAPGPNIRAAYSTQLLLPIAFAPFAAVAPPVPLGEGADR